MVTHQLKSTGMKVYYRLGIWHINFITKLRPGDNCYGWSATIPIMVTHHPMDGYPPSKIYQKEAYYGLGIWRLDLYHKINPFCTGVLDPGNGG